MSEMERLIKVPHVCNTGTLTRTEWLGMRKNGIGGSDAPAILGFSSWNNKLSLYFDKITPAEENDDQNEAAYWGHQLEDIVAVEAKRREAAITKVLTYPYLLAHPEHPFLLANVDRLVFDKRLGLGGLECKTANQFMSNLWAEGSVPEAYQIQCHHYMMVTGLPFWYIACLVGGQKYVGPFRIDRDEDIIDAIKCAELDFWEMVVNRTPPDLDGSEISTNLLKMLYPEDNGKIVEIPIDRKEEIMSLVSQREVAGADIKEAEGRKREAENKMKGIMENAQVAVCGEIQLKWKNSTTERLDTEVMKERAPKIYRRYLKETLSRRFSVKILKEKELK